MRRESASNVPASSFQLRTPGSISLPYGVMVNWNTYENPRASSSSRYGISGAGSFVQKTMQSTTSGVSGTRETLRGFLGLRTRQKPARMRSMNHAA